MSDRPLTPEVKRLLGITRHLGLEEKCQAADAITDLVQQEVTERPVMPIDRLTFRDAIRMFDHPSPAMAHTIAINMWGVTNPEEPPLDECAPEEREWWEHLARKICPYIANELVNEGTSYEH